MMSAKSNHQQRDSIFQQNVELLSQQSSKDHVYPGPDFSSLNQYLKNGSNETAVEDLSVISPESESSVTDNFAVMHNIVNGTRVYFGPSSAGLAEFAAYEAVPEAMLLFLRGHASPGWLNAVGEKHRVSPELYRRHLDFEAFTSGGRDLYSSPSLPSSSGRVLQVTVSTICVRNTNGSSYEPEDLQNTRQRQSEAMRSYFKQLRRRAKVGDSIVRKCLPLSKQEYVLEQTISIEVGPPGTTWRAIIWLDNGRDLSKSDEGPWSPLPATKPWETYFLPVIVHKESGSSSQPKYDPALPTRRKAFSISRPRTHGNQRPALGWEAAQNVCLIPFQYGSRLDNDLACQDALYALSELLQFVASSEVQFLNLVHNRIEHELSFIGHHNLDLYHAVSLLNLKYIKTQLTRHAQRLAETISTLESRHTLDWPRAENSIKTEQVATLLLMDFKYLLRRAEALARECEQGMETLANSSILEESKRSTYNAVRVQKLTLLAAIFIPLSFSCSIWGMNISELGTGSLPFWWWFVTTGPIVLFSLMVYRFDVFVGLFRKSYLTFSR